MTKENKTIKFLKYAIWAILGLSLFTPLLIDGSFLFPYITLKTIYFRIAIEIALFLYIILALANTAYRPRMNKLLWLILGFGLVVLLTGVLGINPYRSFWGTMERGEGWLTLSHLIALTFILAQVLKSKKEWLWFLILEVGVSFLASIYAILPRLGVAWAMGNDTRLSSTLGNAAYMGAYMLGNIWLCLLLVFNKKDIIWKVVFGLIGLFEIYILYQTQTRAAILAFVLVMILMGIGLAIFSKSKRVKIIFGVMVVLLITTSSLVWINRNESWVKSSGTFNRIANISLDDITTQSRLYAWDSSWQAWQNRFLLGYGWENYSVAFNKYFHAEVFRDNGSQIWFDRAHNTVFDVAVASGLVGLLVYLSIFIYAIAFLLKKAFSDRNNFNLYVILAGFLGAHFMQNIFVFDSHATYIMLFSVLGFVTFLINKEKRVVKEVKEKPLNLWALLGGGIVLITSVWFFNILPAKANVDGLEGMKNLYQGKLDEAIDNFKKGINRKTYQTTELRYKLAEGLFNISPRVNNAEVMGKYFNYAAEEIKENMKINPMDTRNYLYLMTIYNYTGGSNLNKVVDLGQQALKLSPTRPQIYFEMGKAEINLKEFDSGVKHFEKAVSLNPKAMESHWNLLTAYILAQRMKEAAEEYDKMLKMGLEENTVDLERGLSIYNASGDYNGIVYFYNKLIKENPGETKYLLGLMSVYKKVGKLDEARAVGNEVIKIEPTFKSEVDKIMNSN